MTVSGGTKRQRVTAMNRTRGTQTGGKSGATMAYSMRKRKVGGRTNPLRRRQAMKTVNRRRIARTKRTATRRPVGMYKVYKGVRAKYSAASKYGVERIVDTGGVMTNGKSVYCGHSTTCIPQQMRTVAYAVVRKLAQKAGIGFNVWDQLPNEWSLIREEGTLLAQLGIYFSYSSTFDASGSLLRSNFIGASGTPAGVADALYAEMRNQLAAAGREAVTFYLVKATTNSGAVPNDTQISERYASMNANSMIINFSVTSELTIQNQTAAALTSTATAGQDAQINEVGNNPLKGLYYTTKGNTFRDASNVRNSYTLPLNVTDSVDIDQRGLIADNENGLIRRDAGASSWAPYPPNPKLIGAKTGNSIMVLPGQLRKSKLFQVYKCHFNTLLIQFQRQAALLGAPNEFISVEWGKSGLFGLRLAMNSATSTANEEKNVRIGYELKWEHKCYITPKKVNPINALVVSRAANGTV